MVMAQVTFVLICCKQTHNAMYELLFICNYPIKFKQKSCKKMSFLT